MWLLEVNSGPAILQEEEAGSLALRLFELVTCVTMGKLTHMNENPLAEKRMIKVLNYELNKSNIKEVLY